MLHNGISSWYQFVFPEAVLRYVLALRLVARYNTRTTRSQAEEGTNGTQEPIELLKQGATVWNVGLREHPEVRPNLKNVDIRSADLRHATLSEANLNPADL